jgi:hypothetical protein
MIVPEFGKNSRMATLDEQPAREKNRPEGLPRTGKVNVVDSTAAADFKRITARRNGKTARFWRDYFPMVDSGEQFVHSSRHAVNIGGTKGQLTAGRSKNAYAHWPSVVRLAGRSGGNGPAFPGLKLR